MRGRIYLLVLIACLGLLVFSLITLAQDDTEEDGGGSYIPPKLVGVFAILLLVCLLGMIVVALIDIIRGRRITTLHVALLVPSLCFALALVVGGEAYRRIQNSIIEGRSWDRRTLNLDRGTLNLNRETLELVTSLQRVILDLFREDAEDGVLYAPLLYAAPTEDHQAVSQALPSVPWPSPDESDSGGGDEQVEYEERVSPVETYVVTGASPVETDIVTRASPVETVDMKKRVSSTVTRVSPTINPDEIDKASELLEKLDEQVKKLDEQVKKLDEQALLLEPDRATAR